MFRARLRDALYFAAMLLSLTGICLNGQVLVGRTSGTITDPSGASVAGAKVAIINTDMQARRTVVSDNKGFYSVAELPIGLIELRSTRPASNAQPRPV